MTYYYLDTPAGPASPAVRQILTVNADASITSFPDVDSNTGPERAAYLEWLAEGNTPEPWPPAE